MNGITGEQMESIKKLLTELVNLTSLAEKTGNEEVLFCILNSIQTLAEIKYGKAIND